MQYLSSTCEERIALLRKMSLFATLPEADMALLAPAVRLCEHAPLERIYKEGEQARHFFLLLSGLVKITHTTADGREILLHLVKAGGTIGEAAVFQQSTQPSTAVALEPTRSLNIAGDQIIRAIHANPDLALRLLAAMAVRLRMFTRKLEAHNSKAIQRLSAWILHTSRLNGNAEVITLDVTREDLANMLGIVRETLSRTLSRLNASGVLSVSKKHIAIHDRQRLAEYASGDELVG